MLAALRRTIQGLDAHQQQGCDDGKVANAIDQETPAFAEGSDHQARDGRTNQPAAVRHGRVDGDGVTEVVPIVDHLNEEGLARGHVEGIDQALKSGEGEDFPRLMT